MTKATPAALTRSASACQRSSVSTTPKCGTGTSWPSTGLVIFSPSPAPRGFRWATI
jgi:hypothetical protein